MVANKRKMPRYGDGAIDYSDFCQRIMFDRQGMEALASKINTRFSELRYESHIAGHFPLSVAQKILCLLRRLRALHLDMG